MEDDPRLSEIDLPERGLLEQLIDEQLITVSELAQLTKRSESTVRRWVRRESWPDVIDFYLIITGLGNDEARRRIIYQMFGQLPVAITWGQEAAFGDGDELDHATDAIYHIARLMQRMRQHGDMSRELTNDEKVEITSITGEALDDLISARDQLLARTATRRKAKPLGE